MSKEGVVIEKTIVVYPDGSREIKTVRVTNTGQNNGVIVGTDTKDVSYINQSYVKTKKKEAIFWSRLSLFFAVLSILFAIPGCLRLLGS